MRQNPLPLRTIVIWLISAGLCVSAGGTIVNLWQRKSVVRDREQDLSRLKKENQSLEAALKESKGDAYVERIARDQLGMVKNGETIVIMPDGRNEALQNEAKDTRPNWKKWWQAFY